MCIKGLVYRLSHDCHFDFDCDVSTAHCRSVHQAIVSIHWVGLFLPPWLLVGSLSNYDEDHNDDFQKAIGLMIKTTALHVHRALFRTFPWRPVHDYYVKLPNLPFYGGRGHAMTNFPSYFWTWIKSLRIQLQQKSPAFDILSGFK